MPAIVDIANQLIAPGVVSSSQDFTPLACAPRLLPTCSWIIAVSIPPAAAATFRLAVSSTETGSYATISTFVWPAGTTGSKRLQVGAGGNLAQVLNNQAAWLRASVTLSGPLTMAGSWLTKAGDGAGLASRSYSLDNINVL